MPENPVREDEIKVLEAKDFEAADFKPLYSARETLRPEELKYGFPTHLDVKLEAFPELKQEDPGDEVMLAVKAKIINKSETAVCMLLEYAAFVHGKLSKVSKVMREYKQGDLKSSSGKTVTDKKQAIAIALSEARKAGEDVAPNPREKERMKKKLFGK